MAFIINFHIQRTQCVLGSKGLPIDSCYHRFNVFKLEMFVSKFENKIKSRGLIIWRALFYLFHCFRLNKIE